MKSENLLLGEHLEIVEIEAFGRDIPFAQILPVKNERIPNMKPLRE